MPKYLCYDDMSADRNSTVETLRELGLEVIYESAFLTPIDLIKRVKTESVDGLLLDLVLDNAAGSGGNARVIANAYAQAARDEMSFNGLRPMPIALWSSKKRERGIFRSDYTAHDLYDLTIDKTELSGNSAYAENMSSCLKSLASAYPIVEALRLKHKGRRLLLELLGLQRSQGKFLDKRIGQHFEDRLSQTHDYIRYLRTEILGQPRPLVEWPLVAARLGFEATVDENQMKKILGFAKYRGVLSDVHERWWWPEIEAWWKKIVPEKPLSMLRASERVSCLNEALHLALTVAEQPNARDTRFWAVCEVKNVPIALSESFLAASSSDSPWHDMRYISSDSAMEGQNVRKVAVVDRERLNLLIQKNRLVS